MRLKWDVWFYGLVSGVIGGGASAVVSGVSVLLVAPQQFAVTDWATGKKTLLLMVLNFCLNGALALFFYLKQSPLPPPVTGNTEVITKNT